LSDLDELRRRAAAALDERDPDVRLARLVVVGIELAGSDDDGAASDGRRLLVRAADDGSPHAAALVALMLLAGRGGPADPAAGLAYLRRAADGGVTTAGLMLGGLLLADDARAAEGVEALRAAAAAGEWSAFWLLGVAHLAGRGVATDGARARALMQVAADHGVVEAHLELARLHELGIGGARSADVAARHERAAAEAGSAEGCLRVAERLMVEPGRVPFAVPWLARAADGGSAVAAARLARLYLAGVDLPYDAAEAERWMARAKALGWDWEPPPTR
jgi:TPR repeat protein